jgi:hypothetical protein
MKQELSSLALAMTLLLPGVKNARRRNAYRGWPMLVSEVPLRDWRLSVFTP